MEDGPCVDPSAPFLLGLSIPPAPGAPYRRAEESVRLCDLHTYIAGAPRYLPGRASDHFLERPPHLALRCRRRLACFSLRIFGRHPFPTSSPTRPPASTNPAGTESQ